MDKFTVIAGIDVAKLSLAVCLQVQGSAENFEVSNDSKGLSLLVNKLKDHEPDPGKILICCENTGRYMAKLGLVAPAEGFVLWAVSPYIISQYHGVKIKRGKTDASDAERIKDFASVHYLEAVAYNRPDQVTLELTSLFNLRKHLVDSRQRHLNYKSSYSDEPIPLIYHSGLMKELIAFFNRKIKEVEKVIKEFISKHRVIKRIYELLVSVPGIGPVIAQRFMFVTQCFQKFKSWRELACYIGTAPFENSSGTSIKRKPRTSKKRFAPFKADLFQGASSVSTREGQIFYAYYQKMIQANNHHFKVINNVINMILKIVFQIVKSDKPFEKDLYIRNKISWN